MRTFLAIILLFATALFGESLEEFTQRLREKMIPVETYNGEFIQTRELNALGMTLEFRGKMLYEKDTCSILWRVEKPIKGAFRIHKGVIAHWDGDSGKSLEASAERYSWVKVVQERLTEWIKLDLRKLEEYTDLSMAGERRIRAVAKEDGILKKVAEAIEIEFTEDLTRAETITIEEKSGDKLIIRFQEPVLNKPLTEKDWEF
ncbi:MAG: hypothetical protein MJ106_00250 [Lentisphaeria bacterium]|nr:hypothetical protein [Lentisphaeria bacterium]